MNMSNLDLNLLRVFDAVHRRRNVSRAASELGMTQSATSNALRRLREMLGDPLFVRERYGVLPTPVAEQLHPFVQDALGTVARGLERIARFDPASVVRTFAIIMTDIAEAVILPRMVEAFRTAAPGVSVRAVNLAIDETPAALRSGEADIAIGFLPDFDGRFFQRHLFDTDYICIAAPDNPITRSALTLEGFRQARHAVAEARGTGHHVVEQTLERLGIERRIGARVPHFLSIPFVVGASDLIATIPRALGMTMLHGPPVSLLAHPVALPTIDVRLLWHERFHEDPANRWLRQQISDVFRTVEWTEPTARL